MRDALPDIDRWRTAGHAIAAKMALTADEEIAGGPLDYDPLSRRR